MDYTIDKLLEEIKDAAVEKDKAERARVNAEQKKIKAHYHYNQLMDMLYHKEYTL